MRYALIVEMGTPGIFSYRIVENDDQKFIGGVESYKVLCRKCYNSQTPKGGFKYKKPRKLL